VPPPPPVKKGVEIIIQTDPIIPPKGPIYGNKPVKLHISKQSEKNEEGTATLDPIVQPLPGNGKIEKEGRLDTENFDMPEEEKVLDPISSRNNPLFKIQSE
jgi:hypothetical protein